MSVFQEKPMRRSALISPWGVGAIVPLWHYCPHCGYMERNTLYGAPLFCKAPEWPEEKVRKCSKKYRRRMIPERFIVVCPEGHVDDFPVAEWLHSDSDHRYNPSSCKIRRSTGGTSASLSGVRYYCTCGASKSISGSHRVPGVSL